VTTTTSGTKRKASEQVEGIDQVAIGQSTVLSMCDRLQISPVKTLRGDSLEEEEILNRIKKDGFRFHAHSDDVQKTLIFLYGKEFHVDDKKRRKKEVAILIKTDNAAHKRLMTVVNVDSDRHNEGVGVRLTKHWKEQLCKAGYLDPNNKNKITIFDDKNIEIAFRRQLSGNCFLQEPVWLKGMPIRKARINQVPQPWIFPSMSGTILTPNSSRTIYWRQWRGLVRRFAKDS
jgi:hypothetical protein